METTKKKSTRTIAFGAMALFLIAGFGMLLQSSSSPQDSKPWEVGFCFFGALVFLFIALRLPSNAKIWR